MIKENAKNSVFEIFCFLILNFFFNFFLLFEIFHRSTFLINLIQIKLKNFKLKIQQRK